MKYLNFICYSLLLMLLFNTSSLYAAPPLADHTTHTPLSLMPEPLSGSRDTFSLAATWWLPDWQGSQGSRGSDDAGGGDHDGNCEKNYGMHTPSNIDNRYICSKYNYNVTSSLKCHVNCRCKDEYKYTSSNCSGNYTTSGTSCEGKYNQCVCKSEFKYNSSNCSGEYEVSGTSCGGNYNGCTIRPECTVSSMSCTYGCAGYNSCDRCTSCKSNPDCDVSDKSCDYGCASTNSCGKCTSCKSCTPSANETGCTYGTESCSDGCGGTRLCCKGHTHSYSCPSGYSSSNSWGSSAQTASKTCSCGATSGTCYKAPAHTHSYSCPSGYSASTCSSNYIQTGTTAKVCSCGATSGTCYKCRAKTCSDGGYVSSCPSGQTGTAVSYAGLTCYNNCHYYMLRIYKCVNGTSFGNPAALHCCLTSNNGKYRVMGSTLGGDASCTTDAKSDAFCAPYVGGPAYYFDCP